MAGQTTNLAWFVAPPFVGLVYAPLADLPYVASAAVWTLLSASMLLIALKLAKPLDEDRNILWKLPLHSLMEAAMYAFREKILDLAD